MMTTRTSLVAPVVELRHISVYHTREPFRRPTNKYRGDLILSEVSLTVMPGEQVYLIGRVGSGKSALMKTLYAEIPLFEGEGKVVGFDLCKLRRRDIPYLRRRIGVVFQDYQLLPDRNVFNNLYYVMRATGWKNEAEIRCKIDEVATLVGLQNKLYKMPFQLSGGEQQRLAIARAVVNDPKVILADEPTGNLDPSAADDVMNLFHRIAENGCAIVMSTHNISNIQQYPSRTFRFHNGKVEEIDIKQWLMVNG